MKDESMADFRRKQMVMKWNDEKGITIVSTINDDCMVPMQTRKGQAVIPSAVINYSKEIYSVDLHAILYCGQKLAEAVLCENILSPNLRMGTERLPCAQETRREQEITDVSH
jgi:hypothetical protein